MGLTDPTIISLLSGIVSMIAAIFIYLKTRAEEKRTGVRIDNTETAISECRRLLIETREALDEANHRVEELQKERNFLHTELWREREKILRLEATNTNQESRIRELEHSVMVLTGFLKEKTKDEK